MSSTRYASEDAPLSQEAYASSSAHETGLLGNLVARRCKAALSQEHRTLCYFIQQLSHRDGGLRRIVDEIIAAFPERFRTATMTRLSVEPGQILSQRDCQAVDDDFPHLYDMFDPSPSSEPNEFSGNADEFFERCRSFCRDGCMEEALRGMCLDPRTDLATVPFCYHLPRRRDDEWAATWWIDDFVGTLEMFRQRQIEAARQTIAETEITRLVHEGIRRATFAKGLAVIEGSQRSGKTVAGRNYCDTHPGECVFIELEAGDDDSTFFRSFARSIGTASSGQLTTIKLRGKIEDMLQPGHLTVVIDESHFLAPLKARPTQAPKRLDWIRRSLLDKGVPVVFLSTPQFNRQCAHYQTHLSWNADQLLGRIVWQKLLPSTLPESEVEAVARKVAPYADDVSIKFLTAYALDASDYLFRIRRIVDNARFLAHQDGRSEPTRADIKKSISELATQVAASPPAPMRTRGRPRKVCTADAHGLQTPVHRFGSDVPPALARRAAIMDSPVTEGSEFGVTEPLRFAEADASD